MGREVLDHVHYKGWVGLAVDISHEDVIASRIDQGLKLAEVRMEEEARAARKKAAHERSARMVLLQKVRYEYAFARSRLRIRAAQFYLRCILLLLLCFTAYAFYRAATDPGKVMPLTSAPQVHP